MNANENTNIQLFLNEIKKEPEVNNEETINDILKSLESEYVYNIETNFLFSET